MKKIIRSSSFCMCFKITPPVMENGFDFHHHEFEPPSKGVKSVLSSSAMNMMCSDSEGTDDVVDSSCRKHKFGRRKLSRYVKAVLFETSLVKKMRNKKSELKSGKAKSKKNLKLPKPNPSNIISLISGQKSCNDDLYEDHHSTSTYSPFTSSNFCSTSPTSTNSASSSATTSRCSSSSMSSSIILPSEGSESFTNNLQGILKFGKVQFHAGTFLLLISLFVLVMWGKICAILCTSTWLFVAIRRGFIKHSSSGSNNAVVDLHQQFSDIDADKYYNRKKVIMEGLLERNHTRSYYNKS